MRKAKNFIPYIVAGIICFMVSVPVFSKSVVLDEAYSVVLSRGSLREIAAGAAMDVHPPLYYMILKVSSLLGGESLLKCRLVTALATYLNLLLIGATVIRKEWGNRAAVIYLLWFGFTYGTVEKTVFLRMYSWGALFVTAAALQAYFYYEKGGIRRLAAAAALTLAAMYTHYYALLAVFLIWVILFAAVLWKQRDKIKQVLSVGGVIVLGYLPWLGNLLAQSRKVTEDYWLSAFDWTQWWLTPAALMESSDAEATGIGVMLYVVVLAAIVAALLRRKWKPLLCILVFGGTMLSGALLSILVTPIWATRYMYVVFGLLALFVALVAGEKTSRWSFLYQGLLVLILCITGGVSLHTMLADELMTCDAGAWTAFAENQVKAGDFLLIDDPYEHEVVYRFYMPEAKIISVEELSADTMEQQLQELMEKAGDSSVWYVDNYRLQRLGQEKLTEALKGYALEKEGSFEIKQKTLDVFRIVRQ